MNKRILMIAPASIPPTVAEGIVNYKLIKVLCEAGYKVDLISRIHKNKVYPVDYISIDENLCKIHYIPSETKITLATIWQHICAYMKFGITYRGAHWAYLALRKALALLDDNIYECVLTKSLPSELVGIYLKKYRGLRWIPTWNDPYPEQKYPWPYGKGVNAPMPILSKMLIPSMVRYADVHIFPSSRLRDYMMKYLVGLKKEATIVIPHIAEVVPIHPFNLDTLRIIHSCNLSYPRDPKTFLCAVASFFHKYPDAKMKIDFLGINRSVSDLVNELRLKDIVSEYPAMPYNDSLKMVKQYDVAVVLEAACEEGIFLPTKVGDYMQCGLNIWSISPSQGELHDLYLDEKISYFSDVENQADIETTLEEVYKDFLENNLKKLFLCDEYLSKNVLQQYRKIL